MSEKLDRKLKLALDEVRLLFLGGQVLLGFQFQAFFQEGFETLSNAASSWSLIGTSLMVVSVTLMVSPVMHHRLVEQGNASNHLLRLTTGCAAASLGPLAMSLSLATYVVIGRRYGNMTGVLSGSMMGGACFLLWYGVETAVGLPKGGNEMKEGMTPLSTKVEQLLTEARLIIPGGGIAAELYVVFAKVTGHTPLAVSAAAIGWLMMATCWYLIPVALRKKSKATVSKRTRQST